MSVSLGTSGRAGGRQYGMKQANTSKIMPASPIFFTASSQAPKAYGGGRGGAGSNGGSGGSPGGAGGRGGDGGDNKRGPQSPQSVPRAQWRDSAPGPPSSQEPLNVKSRSLSGQSGHLLRQTVGSSCLPRRIVDSRLSRERRRESISFTRVRAPDGAKFRAAFGLN